MVSWLINKASLLALQLVWELLWSSEHSSQNWELNQTWAAICDTFFVCRRCTRWTACVASMVIMLSLAELCISGLKSLKLAIWVWGMQATRILQPQQHRMFHEVCATWIPKKLRDDHKCIHLDIFSCHLAHYNKGDNNFLQWIVTGDGIWTHHYQPETKWKGMQ
jgi:hypothetical protein